MRKAFILESTGFFMAGPSGVLRDLVAIDDHGQAACIPHYDYDAVQMIRRLNKSRDLCQDHIETVPDNRLLASLDSLGHVGDASKIVCRMSVDRATFLSDFARGCVKLSGIAIRQDKTPPVRHQLPSTRSASQQQQKPSVPRQSRRIDPMSTPSQ